MTAMVLVQRLCPQGFGTCELKGHGYIGSIYKFEIRYTYPTADEDFNPASIVFEYAIAFRWTADPAVSIDMVHAMDAVMELRTSPWAREIGAIKECSPEHLGRIAPADLNLRHFLVYFDENGCLEVLAQSAEIVKGDAINNK